MTLRPIDKTTSRPEKDMTNKEYLVDAIEKKPHDREGNIKINKAFLLCRLADMVDMLD